MAYHEPYKCQTCGTALSKLEMHQEDSTVVFALKLFFFCVAVILLAILVFAIFPPSGWFK